MSEKPATARVRKIARRRAPGVITVEQTNDRALFDRTLREAAAINFAPRATCLLIAYRGDHPIGAAALATEVDRGVISAVAVVEHARRQGVATALMRAARVAAHRRGARLLEIQAPALFDQLLHDLGFVAQDDRVGNSRSWTLDLSHDGVVAR